MTNPFAPPAQSDAKVAPASSRDDRSPQLGQLLFLQAVLAVAFSVLLGIVTTVQFATGLLKFGGLEYAPRVTVLSVVRDGVGSGASAAAALFAVLVWTHRVEAHAVRSHLRRAAPAVLLVALAATPVTIAVAVASGFLTSNCIYGVPWSLIAASRFFLTLQDLPPAGYILLESLALNSAFCWFALPFMRRRSWSLPQKIGGTWAAFAVFSLFTRLMAAAIPAPGDL